MKLRSLSRGYRRESMKRSNVGSFRALLKSLPRYRLFDPCIVGCIVLCGNEKRNTKRTTTTIIIAVVVVVSPRRRGYRSLFVLVVEEVTKHVRLGSFACTPWQLHVNACIFTWDFPGENLYERDAYPLFTSPLIILSIPRTIHLFELKFTTYEMSQSAVTLIFLSLASSISQCDDGSFDGTDNERIYPYRFTVSPSRFPI